MMLRALIISMVLIGCISCEMGFSPGYSYYDENYFSESPRIKAHGNIYRLEWRYGKMGFFFTPRCAVKGTEMLCSLRGTSSSGNLSGTIGHIELSEPELIEAIKNNRAYWLGPGNEKVKLEIHGNV